MVFALLRILPVLIPIFYFLLLQGLLVWNQWWWAWLAGIWLLNLVYFLLLYLKRRETGRELLLLVHALVFATVGFVSILILGDYWLIIFFAGAWSLVYLLYLESVFHYFYQTEKVLLVNLKNVIAYVNLITLFFLSAFLLHFYIFLNFFQGWVLLLVLAASFILILSRFQVNKLPPERSALYSLLAALILTEMTVAALMLPVSFYVAAAIITVVYYLFSSLTVLSLQGELTRSVLVQYLVFTVVILALIIATAQWL